MPEIMYETREAVPEPFRETATEKDGQYAINVVAKTELDDFRNRNTDLAKERDGYTTLFGRLTTDVGFDREKVDEFVGEIGELRSIKQQVDDGKLVADSSLEDAVTARTSEMKSSYENQLTSLKNTNQSLTSENQQLKEQRNQDHVDREMMAVISDPALGARPEAAKQIMREARDVFSVDENGDLIPKDSRGQIIYGSDGATPMSPKEFMVKLESDSPFFFKSSEGGGAGGSGGGEGNLSPAQLAAMSPEEKMNYGRRQGLNK